MWGRAGPYGPYRRGIGPAANGRRAAPAGLESKRRKTALRFVRTPWTFRAGSAAGLQVCWLSAENKRLGALRTVRALSPPLNSDAADLKQALAVNSSSAGGLQRFTVGWFLNAAAYGTIDHGPLSKVGGCSCVAAEWCGSV